MRNDEERVLAFGVVYCTFSSDVLSIRAGDSKSGRYGQSRRRRPVKPNLFEPLHSLFLELSRELDVSTEAALVYVDSKAFRGGGRVSVLTS